MIYHPSKLKNLVIKKPKKINEALSLDWMLPAATTSRQAITAVMTTHFIPLKTWRGARSLYPKPKVNQLYITTSINWSNKVRVFKPR